MSYINAEEVLPKSLIGEIQKYIDGQLIYIPRKNENILSWGEKNRNKSKIGRTESKDSQPLLFRRDDCRTGQSVLSL